jgi:hypothetical protein
MTTAELAFCLAALNLVGVCWLYQRDIKHRWHIGRLFTCIEELDSELRELQKRHHNDNK